MVILGTSKYNVLMNSVDMPETENFVLICGFLNYIFERSFQYTNKLNQYGLRV